VLRGAGIGMRPCIGALVNFMANAVGEPPVLYSYRPHVHGF
jgi:hypothetical protein